MMGWIHTVFVVYVFWGYFPTHTSKGVTNFSRVCCLETPFPGQTLSNWVGKMETPCDPPWWWIGHAIFCGGFANLKVLIWVLQKVGPFSRGLGGFILGFLSSHLGVGLQSFQPSPVYWLSHNVWGQVMTCIFSMNHRPTWIMFLNHLREVSKSQQMFFFNISRWSKKTAPKSVPKKSSGPTTPSIQPTLQPDLLWPGPPVPHVFCSVRTSVPRSVPTMRTWRCLYWGASDLVDWTW